MSTYPTLDKIDNSVMNIIAMNKDTVIMYIAQPQANEAIGRKEQQKERF